MPDQPPVSRAPGQHEEQERLLRKLLQEQAKQQKALENLVDEVSKLHMIHEVRFSIPHLDEVLLGVQELLVIVKDIQERLVGGGGLSESQEQELAGKLSEATDSLQGAVEANQPVNPPVDTPAA